MFPFYTPWKKQIYPKNFGKTSTVKTFLKNSLARNFFEIFLEISEAAIM